MRLKSGLPFITSTLELTKSTGDLSVQQLTSYSTLVTTNKAMFAQQPQYLTNKVQIENKPWRPSFPKPSWKYNENPSKSYHWKKWFLLQRCCSVQSASLRHENKHESNDVQSQSKEVGSTERGSKTRMTIF